MSKLIEAEVHLIKREHALALRTSTESLVSNCNQPTEQRGRLLCVAIQALFELGRPEDSFEYVYKHSCAPINDSVLLCRESLYGCIAENKFVPASTLNMLYQLRRYLDTPNTAQSLSLIEPYVKRVCMEIVDGHDMTETIDEEIAASYVLEHILPQVCLAESFDLRD